jgi:hypothetical protein
MIEAKAVITEYNHGYNGTRLLGFGLGFNFYISPDFI